MGDIWADVMIAFAERVWLWWRLGDIDRVIILCVLVVVDGGPISSRDISVFNVCEVKSEYWFRDDPIEDGNDCSWPFGQVKEVVEVGVEEKEETGDDKGTVFVCEGGDKNL